MSKYYAVRSGRVPGIYDDWEGCKRQTSAYKGAVFKSFPTCVEAQNYLSGNNTPTESISCASAKRTDPGEMDTILKNHILYCDGGHNKFTGDVAYGCVVNGNSKDLLKKYEHLFSSLEKKDVVLPVGARLVLVANFSDVTSQQNNGAELLAMYAALLIAKENPKYKVIKSDSQLLVQYWSKRIAADKAAKMCPKKLLVIRELIALRKDFEKAGGIIEKISGDDNLADLGFHR